MKKYMEVCLKEAMKAYNKGETPVGAVIVLNGKIIAKAHNKRESNKDPMGHAEVIAIKKACKKINDWRLNECLLFVNLEPCVMCMGLIMETRIKKVYCAISSEKYKNINKVIIDLSGIDVEYGLLESESKRILKDFFKSKR